MDEKTTKLIKERFDTLPEAVKEAILSSQYTDTLIEIGKQYSLNVEQMGQLEQNTTLVMMGLIPTKDFESELTRELHLDKTRGSQIVKDINEKVFFRIRELLKLMNTPAGEEPSLDEEIEEMPTPEPVKPKIPNMIMPQKTKEPARSAFSTTDARPQDSLQRVGQAGGKTHPILAQKLTDTFQAPATNTEHTLENLSKTKELPSGTSTTEIPKKPTDYPKDKDPYRLSPEE